MATATLKYTLTFTQVMADAARFCQDMGFDIVDINFGCPVKKVVRCNGGSGLLRDLPLVEKILQSVRSAISIPLTMKFRAGWNDQDLVTVRMARLAEDCGLAAIAVFLSIYQLYLGQWLQIRWRKWMTTKYLDGWLPGAKHW